MGVNAIGHGLRRINEATWVKKNRHEAKDIANQNADVALNFQRENEALKGRVRELEAQVGAANARAGQAEQQAAAAKATPAPQPSTTATNAQAPMQMFSMQLLMDPFAGMQLPVLSSLLSLSSGAGLMDLSPISAQLAGTPAFQSFPWSQSNLVDIMAYTQAQRMLPGLGF